MTTPVSENAGYFEDAPGLDRQGLMAYGKFVRPGNGEKVIAEGEAQDALYLVLSGSLEVSTSGPGKSVTLAMLGEGDSFGEVNLYDPSNASADVVAKEAAVLWRIRRSEVDDLLQSDPSAGMALLKGLITQLSSRIRVMNKKLLASEQRAWNSTTS